MTWIAVAVVALAGYRVAAAIASDKIAAGLRAWVARRWPGDPGGRLAQGGGRLAPNPSWQVALVNCARCISVWTTLLFTLLAASVGSIDWSTIPLVWPAAAGAACIIIRFAP